MNKTECRVVYDSNFVMEKINSLGLCIEKQKEYSEILTIAVSGLLGYIYFNREPCTLLKKEI